MAEVKLSLGPSLLEKQKVINHLESQKSQLEEKLEMTQECLKDMEQRSTNYGSELIELRSLHNEDKDMISRLTAKLNDKKEQVSILEADNRSLTDQLQSQISTSMKLQREIDGMIYRLNENQANSHLQSEEITTLSKVTEDYEKKLVHASLEIERKTRELELACKARDQKDRHLTTLLKEKEKMHKQIDSLTANVGGGTESDKKPKSFQMTSAKELKENRADCNFNLQMVNKSILVEADSDQVKKEVAILKREVKRQIESLQEKEREIDKLKKENFNLINRCRNTLKK